jgi:hypothetical protein
MTTAMGDLIRFRDDLRRARFNGIREVQDQNGERIVYRSDTELARALAAVEAEIAGAVSRPANTIRFRTSKGV